MTCRWIGRAHINQMRCPRPSVWHVGNIVSMCVCMDVCMHVCKRYDACMTACTCLHGWMHACITHIICMNSMHMYVIYKSHGICMCAMFVEPPWRCYFRLCCWSWCVSFETKMNSYDIKVHQFGIVWPAQLAAPLYRSIYIVLPHVFIVNLRFLGLSVSAQPTTIIKLPILTNSLWRDPQ